MFSKCANPECPKLFDYHEGEFFRFHNDHVEEGLGTRSHAVQHFWLCERCRETYTLRCEERRGVLISVCSGNLGPRGTTRVIAAA
jgi:hypothetical protein